MFKWKPDKLAWLKDNASYPQWGEHNQPSGGDKQF